jgi:peptide/nickel transport system substrate-binding protein
MGKRISLAATLLLVFCLVASIFNPPLSAQADVSQSVPNDTFVEALSYEPASTLDPALAYNTTSGYVLQQVYETLLTYDREKMDQFIPQLADSWDISADGLTYTFHIRSGVKFQDGSVLTPQDVAYSFQRGILQGGTSSPQWLLTEPFLGFGKTDISMIVDDGASADDRNALKANDPATLVAACQTVKNAIVANNAAGTVTMTLAQPWNPFLATLVGTWGSILSQSWVQAQGGWDGSCSTWQDYYAMSIEEDPLTAIMNGTGPFKLNHWTAGSELVLDRNTSYWRTTPMWPNGPSGQAKFNQVILQVVASSTDAANMLVSGDADYASVNRGNYATIEPNILLRYNADGSVESLGNTSGNLLAYDNGLSVQAQTVFFNYDISTSSPYIGTGTWVDGIPANFFSDIHVRKAFNYAFNWDQYINLVYGGQAIQPTGPIIKGLMGYADSQPHYSYDLALAAGEMAQAFGGAAATNGFTLSLVYSQGNTARQIICNILKSGIESLSTSYHVNVVELSSQEYSTRQFDGSLPAFISGWQEDIAHPHNWVVPYLTGIYGSSQNFPQELADKYAAMINACISLAGDEARICYEGIQTTTYDDALDIFLAQPVTITYLNATVQGYYNNPAYFGPYLYALSKGAIPSVNPVSPDSEAVIPFADDNGNSGSLTIPAGAVTEDMQIVIQPDIVVQPLGGGLEASTLAFNIQGYSAGDNSAVHLTFSTPVPITLSYPDSKLIESSLRLYYWNGTDWEDASCGDYVRDPVANTITIPVCHFSQFELGGETNHIFLPLVVR